MRTIDPASLPRLLELESPPDVLYVRGAVPVRPALAVVGTRRADRGALRFARELSARWAAAGVAILSGGAEGIDAAAHRGALDAGGRTFVVQAAPLEKPFPRANRRLFDEVLAAGGGWLGETPSGEAPLPHRFLARNRLIAALADAVLVVQAPFKSGALSTARWATRLGRPLFAVPAAPWDPRSAGGAHLLREPARPCLVAEDLEAALGRPLDAPVEAARVLRGELGAVYSALGAQVRHPDDVAAEAGLPVQRVNALLTQLGLEGLAGREPGGWRALALAAVEP